ncbi:MAG: hypothetical protein CMM07_25715 [Rhodopirellula sp.]|nr:hypothetical protein [Rhodopirellula sp.]
MDIRTLKEGEKITEPGFYNIPLSVHHSQPCEGISVTSGVLRMMELESPAQVWAHHQLNPNSRPKKRTKAMYIGAAMAALIAGGLKELWKQFLVLPEDMPYFPKEETWKAFEEKRCNRAESVTACIRWQKVLDDPRDSLTLKDVALLRDMAVVLSDDPSAQLAITGLPEITMAAWDDVNQLWLLSRPDTVNITARIISDYKKMATKGEPFTTQVVDRNIDRHGYGMQLAFGCDVFQRLTGHWLENCAIAAQWESYPHHVIIRPIEEHHLVEDMWLNRRAAKRFRKCLDSGHWPGPGQESAPYRRPDWRSEWINKQMENEGPME